MGAAQGSASLRLAKEANRGPVKGPQKGDPAAPTRGPGWAGLAWVSTEGGFTDPTAQPRPTLTQLKPPPLPLPPPAFPTHSPRSHSHHTTSREGARWVRCDQAGLARGSERSGSVMWSWAPRRGSGSTLVSSQVSREDFYHPGLCTDGKTVADLLPWG